VPPERSYDRSLTLALIGGFVVMLVLDDALG
jgi:hypothetical protein